MKLYIPLPNIQHLAGAPVTELVKRWPLKLVIPGSNPARDGNLFSSIRDSVTHNLLYCLPMYRFDIPRMLLERAYNCEPSMHLYILYFTPLS